MLNNNRGSVLVMTLLIFATLAIMGALVLNVALAENRFVDKEHDYQQAYYIARAGAEAAATYFESNSVSKTDMNKYLGNASDNEKTDFAGGGFKVGVMKDGSSDDLIIESIGEYEGLERTVKVNLKKSSVFIEDAAIISKNTFKLQNFKSEVIGDVIIPTGVNVEGDGKIIGEINHRNMVFEDPVNPRFVINSLYDENTTISNEYDKKNIGSIIIANKENLIVDLNGDMELQMSSLNIKNGGKLSVTGDGFLVLYVSNVSDIKGIIEVDEDGDAKLLIVCLDDSDINIKTASKTYVYAFIYAPNSLFSVSNNDKAGYKFRGAAICKKFFMKNDTTVKYDEISEFPEDIVFQATRFNRTYWSTTD